MKRWFCGFASKKPSSAINLVKPRNGKLLWNRNRSNKLWACGAWKQQQLITISEGPIHLAIIGSCLAERETLVKLFQNAIEENDYSQLMKLPGSYNAIVQDRDDTYIFIDAAGIRSAFYAVYQSNIVYSSLGLALKELLNAKVDRTWLANSLCHTQILNLANNPSPFAGVKSIPSGHYLHISSGKATCKRYWHGPKEYVSFSEAAEQLRKHLSTAVEGRINLYGDISSDLSGGYDSTTLALLAAKTLDKKGKKLHTLTDKSLCAIQSSDVKCAEHAASLYESIEALWIENDEIPADYSHLELVPLTDEPHTICICAPHLIARSEIIKSTGSQLHLNGDGADEILTSTYPYFADLLKRRQLITFFKHIYGRSRVGNFPILDLINSSVKLSLISYPEWWKEQIKQFKIGALDLDPSNINISLDRVIGWDFLPQFASWYSQKSRNLVLEAMEKWAAVATPMAEHPSEHQSRTMVESGGKIIRNRHHIFEINDVNLESPYLDRLVIDACLSAKPEERYSPYAYKPLLPKAFERDLPQSIYQRNTKGDYTREQLKGFRKNKRAIEQIFQHSLLADLGLIDLKELKNPIEHLSMGLFPSSIPFSQTLATELWLRRLSESKMNFWISADSSELFLHQEREKIEVNF